MNIDPLSRAKRKAKVIDLYLAGNTYREIREETGLSLGIISRYINEAVEEANKAAQEGMRKIKRLEVMKIDRLIKAFWPKAIEADVQAASMVLKLLERKADMLGLDAPFRIENMTNDELIKAIAELGETDGVSPFAPGSSAPGHLLSATIQA